jgi:hemerythrin superfamily protein
MFDDVFDILMEQHAQIKETLAALALLPATKPVERRRTSEKLAEALISHTQVEAQVLYKRLEDSAELREAVAHHREEHEQINKSVRLLLNVKPDDRDWSNRLARLSREFERHVSGEEEDLFPKAREFLETGEARKMVEEFNQLQDRRKNLMQP